MRIEATVELKIGLVLNAFEGVHAYFTCLSDEGNFSNVIGFSYSLC